MTPDTPNANKDVEPIELAYAGDAYEPPSNAGAKTAMVLGVVSVTVGFIIPIILGVLAVVVSVAALVRIQRYPHRHTGRRLARIGVVLGICGLIVPTVVILKGLRRARELSVRTVCLANLLGIGQAIQIYAQGEPDGAFPDDLKKLIAAGIASPKQFVCRSVFGTKQSYYYVSGCSLSSDPNSVVMFETIDNHDGDGGYVLYQDGHVLFLSKAQLQKVIDDNKDRAQ